MQWVLGTLSLQVKQVEYEVDHSSHLVLKLRVNEGISPLTIMPSCFAHGQLYVIFELEVSVILRYDTALLVSRFQTLLYAAVVHYIF